MPIEQQPVSLHVSTFLGDLWYLPVAQAFVWGCPFGTWFLGLRFESVLTTPK